MEQISNLSVIKAKAVHWGGTVTSARLLHYQLSKLVESIHSRIPGAIRASQLYGVSTVQLRPRVMPLVYIKLKNHILPGLMLRAGC